MPHFRGQKIKFKINVSHSFILQHRVTGVYRFYHASANNARAFEMPLLISDEADFLRFLERLNDTDVLEYAKKQRPDSAWMVRSVVSTSVYINPLRDYPLGCCDHPLPQALLQNEYVNCLVIDANHGKAYSDNLCFFRCLALHGGAPIRGINRETRRLALQWLVDGDLDSFQGVTLADLPAIEERFGPLAVDVFEWTRDNTFVIRHRSDKVGEKNRLRVLSYKNHFCYISDLNKAARSFACPRCGRVGKRQDNMRKHVSLCQGRASRERYPGGVYRVAKTPLEILADNGILVPSNYVFPYRATYDFESMQTPLEPGEKKNTEQTSFLSRHVPVSVSVCSNVPEHEEPVCFVSEGDPGDLVRRMMTYLRTVSEASFRSLRDVFGDAYEQIEGLVNPPDLSRDQLMAVLDGYLGELPCVGFNSSGYDLNVIKPHFFRALLEEEVEDEEEDEGSPIKFIVKNNNEFKCVATPKLKFLDIKNYLAPGFSYSKYLAAYEVREKKGFFPYEYLTDLNQLDEPRLPPKEAFYSTLREKGISDEDYDFCRSVWRERGMTTFRDFLVWYNNLDVVPFLEALDKQAEFYQGLGLDLLKDGLGIPGLTLRYLFQTLPGDMYFSLINHKHRDLHSLLREQIVGGPSLVFHRYHEKGVTRVRGGSEVVSSIVGYDANALYLYALSRDMPTGHPVRRRKDNGFKAEKVDKFGLMARQWLDYVSERDSISIRHKYNDKEKALGPKRVRVDGWCAETLTAYQFQGCLFHGHECQITAGLTVNPLNGKSLDDLSRKTEETTAYLRTEVGVTVVEVRECEWKAMKADNGDLRRFLRRRFPPKRTSPFSDDGDDVTTASVIKAVRSNDLFGLVQCDITVPEASRARFAELQPIFKNAEVGRDDIGGYMRRYAEEHDLLRRPRRTLVASYEGRNILLATPLLRWYLHNGLEVTDIQQVVEYVPSPCFLRFSDDVSEARRQGDAHADKAILAESFKLMGNSAYGKTLTNVSTHREVVYVSPAEAGKLVSEPRFQKLTSLDDQLEEVELDKKKLSWSLPLQIGFFVYQYAKLRMLEMYYDLIDEYLDRKDFQLIEMDTDSLYLALSGDSLEDCVRPSDRERFFKNYHLWFPSEACDKHKTLFVRTKTAGLPWREGENCESCRTRRRFDKRLPGVFKEEYRGEGMVALCSKTYYCFGEGSSDKCSSKGLSKTQNKLTKDRFLEVLRSEKSGGGTNRGFRTDGKAVYTYTQTRKSLSFFYIKRRVRSDGVSTKPLLI